MLDPALLPPRPAWPDLPAVAVGERRLSLTPADIDAGRFGTQVTVTCEEHYQNAIEAAMPPEWDPERTWPLLVELVVTPANPHTRHGTPCIEVRSSEQTVSYITPKMTERNMQTVRVCVESGLRATAMATVSRGPKGGQTIWQIMVQLQHHRKDVASGGYRRGLGPQLGP